MVRKKGYIGLSVSLLVLFTALFFIYNSQPVTSTMADGESCEAVGEADWCGSYEDCPSCEADPWCWCVIDDGGDGGGGGGGGPPTCTGGQYLDGNICVCPDERVFIAGRCEQERICICGNDICESGCTNGPDESGWNCPYYSRDGSGGGDCPCDLDEALCDDGSNIFESYTNCDGKVFDCGDGYKCYQDECVPVCYDITCNSPPSSYCSGSTQVYYNSPGTCSGGDCGYSTGSSACPTSGCSVSWRQSGGCTGGSCYMNNAENCGTDYLGCSDSETRAYRSQGCDGGSCYGSWLQPYDCNTNNYCSDSGSSYSACADSNTAVTRQDRVYKDYSCSGGDCSFASQYASVSCPPVDTDPVTCSDSHGWYDTSGCSIPCDNAPYTAICKAQEFRSYSCPTDSCTYTSPSTRQVVCWNNENCDNQDGWYGGGDNGCGTYTDPTSYYRNYYPSGGSCTYTNTESRNYDSSDAWYGGGDAGPGCSQTTDPTSYHRDYFVTANTPNSDYCNADSKNCDSSDGWSGGGNTAGCGSDPSSQYYDYYVTANTGTCASTTAGCGSKNCDLGDSCGYVCDGTQIKQYLDSYVITNTNTCSSYYGSFVEDCATKASVDSDGDNPQVQGTVTDYTSCSGGSCTFASYTDACTSVTQVREYLTSGSSYTNYVKNCEEYEPTATYCSGNNVMRRDWGCSSGSCSDAAATDTVVNTCPPGLGCDPATGQCRNSKCDPNPCTSPPATGCSDINRVTYPNPGICTQSGGTYSCAYPPTYTPCPSTDCSGTTRRYSGNCSGGNCVFGGTEDCAAKASVDDDGNNAKAQGTCTDYTGCSGGSCMSTPAPDECRDSNIMREYYASGASCTYQDYDCRNFNTYYCSGSNSMQHVWGCTSSPGYCVNTADVVAQACANGCNPSTGQCYATLCSPNPCTGPPTPNPTCSGSNKITYPNPGTCTQSGGTYSCAYPASTTTCTASPTDCSGTSRCTYSAGCSSGNCYNTPSCTSCPTPAATCTNPTTIRTYSPTCSGGTCDSTYTDAACSYQCASGICITNPCSPNPCNSVPENTCSGGSLNVYSSSCTPSGGTYSCAYPATPQFCQYGCLSLPGPDQCDVNSPPTFSSVSALGAFGSFAKSGQTVTMSSSGSDPNGEQIKLKCGSASGNYNLCTGSLAANNPVCSFTNAWADSTDHTIYCALEDSAGATSIERTTTVSADNTGPILTLTRSPYGLLTPGTLLTLTADASDARSGMATINIVVDGSSAKQCSSTICTYTFTPSYGTHNYSASAADNVGNSASLPSFMFTVNDMPVVQPITYTGTCTQGNTITLQCTASDANQAANSLSVKGWIGECTAGNCFATRSWIYLNNQPMTAPSSGGIFTKDITITSSAGTGITATCQATDSLSAVSNWGDPASNPLCTVDNCQNPPTITFNSITPNPSGAGTLTVVFTPSSPLSSTPVVKIKPGSQTGGTTTRTGSCVAAGSRYTCTVTVDANDRNGIADVWVESHFASTDGNCPVASGIQQVTIDTTPPTTSILCNNVPCSSSTVYIAPMSLTFVCTDTTSCASTVFGLDSAPNENYTGARQISVDGVHTINYRSTDRAGNVENLRSQNIRIFRPPCIDPAEEPLCIPDGFVDVELYTKLSFKKTNVLRDDDAWANLYCFLRTKDVIKRLVRPCSHDVTKLSIIVDKGTANTKDYFSFYNGWTPPSRADFVTPAYQKENSTYTVTTTDSPPRTYTVARRWEFKLPTTVFHSNVCVNVTDLGTGISVETCGGYTVTESEFLFSADFPDLGVSVPLTVDPEHDQVANFTKTMLINFIAVPSTMTFSGISVCEPPSCRVDFSFDAPTYDKTTKWDAFQKGFVASNVIDIASNNFACDQYKTLYLQAQQAGGPTATTSKEFFVNCQTKITVTPVEKRFTLGNQVVDNAFTLTIYNPKEGVVDKIFNVTSTTTSPIFNFQWIEFKCTEDGCTIDPVNNDKVELKLAPESQKSFSMLVSTLARAGSFPITFVAEDIDGYTYSTTASILVFSEGLDEFASWQLIILVIVAVALIAYYKIDLGHKKRKTSKRK